MRWDSLDTLQWAAQTARSDGRGPLATLGYAVSAVGALETLRRREWTIAWVRWSAAALAAGQILVGGPVAAAPTVVIIALLAVVGLGVAVADRRLTTAVAWRQVSAVLMAVDLLATLGLVLAGLLQGNDELWVLLVLVVLAAALRYRIRGALAVALGAGLANGLLELLVNGGEPGPVIVGRLLVLLVVGGFAGSIARELDVERRLYQRMAEASQDIVAKRDEDAILGALARHVKDALDGSRATVHRYTLAGWEEVQLPDVLSVDSADGGPPLLTDEEGGVSATLHRLTWQQGSGRQPNRLTLPIRLPERPAEYVVAVEVSGPRPSALAEGALLALAESSAVSLATRDLIRHQEASNRRLERLEALRTRFVATVAHDLRSPLTTVKGVARILRGRREQVAPEQVDAMLASVERQANRLNRLADDLLDAARLDSDALELKLTDVAIDDILRSVVDDAGDEVELLGTPGLVVEADGPRLERVVWNLVTNALKYGRPPVHLCAETDGDQLTISVRDHGRGLGPEQVENLFQDFAGSGDPDSVGLGLAIVWELVEAHGGRVEYRPADPGADFVISIPRERTPGGSDR